MGANTTRRMALDAVETFIENGGTLLDVLVAEHYAARHIPGAYNACVYEMVFLDTVAALGVAPQAPVAVYGGGDNSREAEVAAEKLVRAGFTDVSVLRGGLAAWRVAGRPLAGTAPDVEEPPHPALHLEDRDYAVQSAESLLRWTGRNTNGSHSGTLAFKGGCLTGGETPTASFVMDMRSLRNSDLDGDELRPVLETHLASDDFFFTALFPEATFTATLVRLVENAEASRPNAMMQGVLRMRGVSNEIAFPVHIRNLEGGRIVVMGDLDIDRTQWGVLYGSSRFFKHLGKHVVFDFVSVDFRVVLA